VQWEKRRQTKGCVMSDQIKTIRRFFRKLHRSLLNSIPNDGPKEVDLTKLQSRGANDPNLEFSMDWRSSDKQNDVPGHSKT
jgi:hypothetical protein